jgi:uncharacterized protein (TIGR01244 family)
MDRGETMAQEYLDDEFAVSPQIAASDLETLKDAGFKSVFCLRPDHEEEDQPDFEEIAEAARSAGLDIQHLPVVPSQISDDDHASFKAMLEAAPKPVLAYCKTGGRAKALWKAAKS